jgi:hypothetical protein
MATGILPTNLADAVRVAPAALVEPEDPAALAVPAALVEPEDLVELAVSAALVEPEDPVELVVRAALAVPEDPAALAVPESPAVLVALVAPAVRAALVVSERPAVPVARELVRVEAVAVPSHLRAPLAVALRTKSVIAAHRPDLAPLLEAAVDLVAVAETTREPAAAEAVIAWAVADTVEEEAEDTVAAVEAAAVTEPAAVAADAAVVAADAAVAAEDAEDKGGVNDEETNENKNKYYDFAENFSGRFCDPYFLFVNDRSARCAIGQNRCACNIAAKPKRIRLTEAGC